MTGAAGNAGASGGLVYSTDPATFGGQPRCQGFDVCESFESTELGALPSQFNLEGYGTRTVGASADHALRGARSLKLELAAQGEFGTEGDRSAHPRVDDWMCLEWSFDASKQVAQYYLDGASIDYLRIDTERAEIPVLDSLAVGFGKYQNTGAFLVYIDEVAFDGERIGCNN
jgi:hypothetical protein